MTGSRRWDKARRRWVCKYGCCGNVCPYRSGEHERFQRKKRAAHLAAHIGRRT